MPHVIIEPLRGNTCIVRTDGTEAGSVSKEVLKIYPEMHDTEVSEDDLAMFLLAGSLYAALVAALRCLAGRSCSSRRLSKIIEDKSGVSPDTAAMVAAMFELRGYINDFDLAWNTAQARINRKPVGPRDIRRHLVQKMFSRLVIDTTVKKIFEEHDETELAFQALLRRYGEKEGENNPGLGRKFSLFLSQRGFGFSAAAAACRRYWNEAEKTRME